MASSSHASHTPVPKTITSEAVIPSSIPIPSNLYNFGTSDIKKQHSLYTYNLGNVVQSLKGNSLDIEFINGIEGKTDAIVTYTKKLNR